MVTGIVNGIYKLILFESEKSEVFNEFDDQRSQFEVSINNVSFINDSVSSGYRSSDVGSNNIDSHIRAYGNEDIKLIRKLDKVVLQIMLSSLDPDKNK
jgi:hypothetical protein